MRAAASALESARDPRTLRLGLHERPTVVTLVPTTHTGFLPPRHG